MQYKLIFLTFIFTIFFFKNGFCMNTRSKSNLAAHGQFNSFTQIFDSFTQIEDFLTQIEENNIETVKKMAEESPYLVNIIDPIPPIIYAVGIKKPNYQMISTLIELRCDINPEYSKYQPAIELECDINPETLKPPSALVLIITKILLTDAMEKNSLLNILQLLLENGVIVTEEILKKCDKYVEIQNLLLSYVDEPTTEESSCQCSLM